MKLNVWFASALAPLTAVMVWAQDTASAPAANAAAPAPKSAPAAAKTPKRKASPVKKTMVLNPPAAATVTRSDVNVRGQASFAGETLGHLQKGDTVTVLERITLSHHSKDEPAEWARITLPAGIPVWVDGDYVDSEAKTIKARRVHLRGGPGENYSVVGHLEKGAAINEIKKQKGWMAIEAPTNAYAYVAAEFLEMQPPPAVAVTTTTTPAPAPAPEPQVVTVTTPPPPVAAAQEPAAAAPVLPPPSVPAPAPAPLASKSVPNASSPVPPPPAPAPQQSEADRELEALHRAEAAPVPAQPPTATPAPGSAPAPSASSEPVTPRVVTRQGFVRRAYNIQAPADFELHDIQSGTLMDYLQPKPGQNFKIFVGTRVTVTGPEGIDSRWPRTPVLAVQNVDLMP